jgi:hypothetical protein
LIVVANELLVRTGIEVVAKDSVLVWLLRPQASTTRTVGRFEDEEGVRLECGMW